MDESEDPIDTSDSPKCPDCGYIVFLANHDTDGDYYCMECSTAWDEADVDEDDTAASPSEVGDPFRETE